MDYVRSTIAASEMLPGKALTSEIKNYRGRFDKPILKPDILLSDDDDETEPKPRTESSGHFVPSDDKYVQDKLNKAEEKRLKWNAYMKKYNERKRKEREERLNYVSLNFRNNIKLYKVDDINKILVNFIVIMEEIFNNNAERFDPKIADEINTNADDIVKYCELLYNAIIQIL